MALLITKGEVLALAFSDTDQITEDIIKDTKIEAAQEKYIRPVFGDLYDAMTEGRYTEFVEEYIKAPLAYYVRYGLIPDMTIQMGNNGATVAHTHHANAASNSQREMLRKQALDDGDALIRKAIMYVEKNRVSFPEYSPRDNSRKRISRTGGIVLFNSGRK